jgi:ferritin
MLRRSFLEGTEKLFNQQVEIQGKSSAYYLSMRSWYHMMGYENASRHSYTHSDEERMNMMKIFLYINEAGGHTIQPEITGIRHNFNSLREIFELILQFEIKVTKSINNIVDHAFSAKDFETLSFMQWYVTEQREEETMSRRALELFEIIGEAGIGLWTIDQELGKLHSAAAAAEG